MRVRDIMSSPVYTVRAADSVVQAVVELAGRSVTAAPVLDGADRLVGIVSEADLLWRRVPPPGAAPKHRAETRRPRPGYVHDVMTHLVLTARPEDDISTAAQTMLDNEVRSLPVVEDGHVVGIISRRDILRAVVRTDDVLCHEVQHRLDEYAGGTRRWTVAVVNSVATIDGAFDDEIERKIVTVLASTVPGVAKVCLAQPVG